MPDVAPPAQTIPPPAPREVSVLPITGLPEIREGDDLGALLARALAPLGPQDGDVLCLSTKVVSKALGLRIAPEERDEAIRAAAVRTVARRLQESGERYGIAAICIGVGQGLAVVVENVNATK